ncbi:diguanylate cyclase domain-containing protein [Litorilituus lipolyticus]|uniref:Diguanylate cyclase n=1 Tax=Litorilituus lipolyticus TaxID=2491017 RepID=A0A502L2F6_9GAMM|nr:diguanylate cyclase [Litorilituus lipolyticus]TPH18108.1 diguanylate cyclase [Litorilituus lipolyticus]
MIKTSQCIVSYPPEELDFEKWQRLVNLMAKLYNATSGVVVQFRQESFNVVSTSDNADNFLKVNSSWPWDMKSFCRKIIETNDKLYVNNAKDSDEWSCSPPVAEGPVRSYLGYPLYWPDGSLFGSFCVIDTKPTEYPYSLIEMLEQLKLIVESELKHVFDKQKIKSLLAENIDILKVVEQEQTQAQIVKSALSLQESINTATLASLIDSVIRINQQGTILSCNLATESIFGYSPKELIGKNVNILSSTFNVLHEITKPDASYSDENYAELIQQFEAQHKNGNSLPVQLSVSQIKIGSDIQFIALLSDISDKVQHEQMLKQLALYDSLTNCANRNLLNERFEYELAKAKRDNLTFSIAYLDLNEFKPINDKYGHQAGDIALITIVKRIKQVVRSHDLVARVGGDEFVVLFNNSIDAQHLKTKLLHKIRQPIPYEGHEFSISSSIGVASYPNDAKSLADLLRIADNKMYLDKKKK